ncbi:MAG: hypothetical protein GQ529_10045 [Methyloprofundus sp.]|nr:hypothetical protein [Methyloprofundus sp.]
MKNFIISCLLLLLSTYVVAEIVVIGNIKNTQQLSALQIQDIYMGRTRTLPDGKLAYPFDQADLRGEFYLKLTQRPVAQINAYWARLMFSGQTSPPTKLPDDQSIIEMVKKHEGAIGYINKENVDKSTVHILLMME